jgi:hypothetical protein
MSRSIKTIIAKWRQLAADSRSVRDISQTEGLRLVMVGQALAYHETADELDSYMKEYQEMSGKREATYEVEIVGHESNDGPLKIKVTLEIPSNCTDFVEELFEDAWLKFKSNHARTYGTTFKFTEV